jgi:poly(A) polymerase
MRFKDVERMRTATLKRFVRMPRFNEHLELHRLDCTSSHRHLNAYNYIQTMLAETPREDIHPFKLLTGDDLLAMGYRPGPVFGQILATLEDAQLEGKVETKEDAAQFIRSKFKPKNSTRSEEEAGIADSQGKGFRRAVQG